MHASVHLSTDDVALGHADNRKEPKQVQHLKYAKQHIVRVVYRSHADNSSCLKQRAIQNSMSTTYITYINMTIIT